MYHRTTIGLFVVTAGLLIWVFTIERHLDDSIVARAKALRVLDFGGKPPTGITIEGPQGKIVLKNLRNGPWEMREPVKDRADQKQVMELLRASLELKKLETIKASEIRKEKAKPDDLGLGSQAIKITYTRGERVVDSLMVGSRVDAYDAVWVMKEEDWGKAPVYVVFSDIRDIVEQEADLLRDNHVFDLSVGDIRRFKFVKEGSSLTVRRFPESDSAVWKIFVPLESRGDKEEIEDRVSGFMNLEILEFIDKPTTEITGAFTDSQRYIELRQRGEAGALRMDIAELSSEDGDDTFLARVAGRRPVFRVSKDTVDRYFTINPNDVRDRRLADFNRDAVIGLKIEAPRLEGGQVTVMERQQREGWVVVDGEESVPANSQAAMDLISALNREMVTRFVSDGAAEIEKYGLHDPGIKVTVISRFLVKNLEDPDALPVAEEFREELRIGLGRYAKFDGKPFIYELDPDFVASINPRASSWRALDLLRFNLLDVKQVALDYPGAPTLKLFCDFPSSMITASLGEDDVTGYLNQRDALQLIEALSGLRADQWVNDLGNAEKRLERPQVTITTDLVLPVEDGKKVTHVVELAPTAPQSELTRTKLAYGRVSGIDGIFLLKGRPVTALAESLIDPVRERDPAPESR